MMTWVSLLTGTEFNCNRIIFNRDMQQDCCADAFNDVSEVDRVGQCAAGTL